MQEHQIPFKGIALTPYADSSPDGQLAACSMLEQRGGALRPTMLPGDTYQVPEFPRSSLILIGSHITTGFTHYIFSSSQGLYYTNQDFAEYHNFAAPIYATNVTSVGNTLIILSADGPHYYLYTDNTYKYLGTKPDEINISFGLWGKEFSLGTEEFSVEVYVSGVAFPIKDTTAASNKVWETINKEFVGYSSPFFVRAAYRLNDGTHYMATPPVLMIPDSKGTRALLADATLEDRTENGVTTRTIKGTMKAQGVSHTLVYKILDAGNLEQWKDIISGIDVFMTPRICPYNVDGEIKYIDSSFESSFGLYSENLQYGYEEKTMQPIGGSAYFMMPWKEEEDYLNELESASQFYKFHSFTVDEYIQAVNTDNIPKEFGNITAETLQNLTLQETLNDAADYQSHDTIIADNAFVYNRSLHMYGITRQLFRGFTPEVMWPYTDGGNTSYTITVRISMPDGNVSTVKVASAYTTLQAISRYFYYPDANATRMIVYDAEGTPVLDVPLKPHPFLNGAYYAWLNNKPSANGSTPALPEETTASLELGNKLYVSEVDNPYRFPLESIYTIGTGSILGLATIATALSQGQFGQFPLMAFCSDGNYTLSVTGEGKYSTVSPMSRDVCINPQSITPTDNEILFVTSKGVMITSGASAQLLSAELDGVPDTFVTYDSADGTLMENPLPFFAQCRIIFDYANRRMLFVSVGNSFAYIYNIETASWSTAEIGSVKAVLNSYPYPFIQFEDGSILKINRPYPFQGETQNGLIITRPVKFDTLQYKVLHQLTLQGVFANEPIIKIYGSQDGTTWCYLGAALRRRIGHMRGRPFKYFRFSIATKLAPTENITGLRVGYEVRTENRLR